MAGGHGDEDMSVLARAIRMGRTGDADSDRGPVSWVP